MTEADQTHAGGAPDDAELRRRCIDVIRGLALDAPQRANSGHTGTAMALAPLAYTLWTRLMRYDASEPDWPDRDRFILSAGHASILLYSMLHLTGYGLEKEDLEQFRQWGSRTPGHPEVHHTRGVEVTTGPLGQGLGNAVGMALAEHHLRARFGPELFDHRTFVIASDGDLMEGISHEAASLAGHLGIDRLVVVYDDNRITIDGATDLACSDDAAARFEAYGWHVDRAGEISEDIDALEAAIRRAMAVEGRPSLIVLRSHIGYPSPKMTDTSKAHGNPFGEQEVRVTKELLGLPPDTSFWIPDDVLAFYREAGVRHRPTREAWEKRYAEGPQRATIDACLQGRGLPGWEAELPTWQPGGDKIATRNASKACLNAIVDVVPGLVAGGADLTDNTGTALPGQEPLTAERRAGRQVFYGVREHAMGAVMNGLSLHGGVLPVGGTFLVFSDYLRPAVRLAALSEAHVVYSFTHDSVGLGEDGPTHQPIEHLPSLRAIPGLSVIRPADANETAMAWRAAVDGTGPTALVLSRQNLPILDGTAGNEGVLRGAYVLREAPAIGAAGTGQQAGIDVVLVASGSEVAVALDAATLLEAEGIAARVVSMPCWELFERQDDDYRESVMAPGVARVSVEAASTFGWERHADTSVGIDRFGASAPGGTALDKLGINPSAVVERVRRTLGR